MDKLEIRNGIYYGSLGRPSLFDLSIPNDWNHKLVIFVHGFMGFKDWGAWNLVQAYFVSKGFGFAKFNLSHNGGTTEQGLDFPDLEAFSRNTYSKEIADIGYVRGHISTLIQAEKTYLIGHSRGGGDVILHAQSEPTEKIALWASISDIGSRFPTGQELTDWQQVGQRTVFNGRTQQQLPQSFGFYEDFKSNEAELNIQAGIKALKIPLIIFHGEDDSSVPISEGEELALWSKNSLIRVKNADHVFGSSHPWTKQELPPALLEICKRTLAFFEQDDTLHFKKN